MTEGSPRRGRGRGRGRGGRGGRGAPRGGPRPLTPEQVEARRASVPELTWPDLPVVERKDELAAAIRDHQVVVVAGETGSGKTTQLPKICLEIGRGVTGMIGHTQPRRIAARSVADRIAEELGVDLEDPKGPVGYQVRFTDTSSPATLVKVMTDGILLNAMQHDRDLRAYDTLIIDEAHERSLNIDFILGYLHQLLPRRPDLKVIITSATIDPERFAAHFADTDGEPAPIIEVSGRTYPVEIRYRPLSHEDRSNVDALVEEGYDESTYAEDEIDQVTGIAEAVQELWTEDIPADDPRPQDRDVLVFCSGEREIRDAADHLEGLKLPGTEILPLYGRLSAAEQQRVFKPHGGRRVVLATNVAETSLTVPGIRYVVDTGTARISRYSQRLKVQRLPIEKISQASANQRAGRSGRVSAGICIRLYSQEDFEARPEFTDPEIARTSLASVILQMAHLGLGDVERFGFVDRPDPRQVTDGLRLLHELGAVTRETASRGGVIRLTRLGRELARIPADPRLARMLVEAHRRGALAEVLVIVAGLSIQDPRERPAEKRDRADQLHARFKDEESDFVALLNLWQYVREQKGSLSGSAFRRMCHREFLHYLRLREWVDVHHQLRQVVRQMGWEDSSLGVEGGDSRRTEHGFDPVEPGKAEQIHRSLLPGLLSQVGLRDRETRDYLGARGAHFSIQPGSGLFRTRPDWVVSAELVETTRLWARTNAAIDPAWVEEAAEHLVKKQYSEPRWSAKRASAVADERVTLLGIPLVAGRMVGLAKVDPALARELFIRHALVEGDWSTGHAFWAHNKKVLAEVEQLEARSRRRDLLDDQALFDFYDQRLPAEVVSRAHFESWWKKHRREEPELLDLSLEAITGDDAETVDAGAFPTSWEQGELVLPLTYQFEPGSDADGVTAHLTLSQLNRVVDEGFDWQVPGLREELAVALLRSLPKAVRRSFVPAPDHAAAAMSDLRAELDEQAGQAAAVGNPLPAPVRGSGSFAAALARTLIRRTGTPLDPADFDPTAVPAHLRMTFRVTEDTSARGGGKAGGGGSRRRGRQRPKVLGESNDLATLQAELAGHLQQAVAGAAAELTATGLTDWTIGELPAHFEADGVQGWPALVDEGRTAGVQVLADRREAEHAHALGLRRLVLLAFDPPWSRIQRTIDNRTKLALGAAPHGSTQALLEDALAAAVDSVVAERLERAGEVRDRAAFDEVVATVKQQSAPRVLEMVEAAGKALSVVPEVQRALEAMTSPRLAGLRADLEGQLAGLVHPTMLTEIGYERARHLPRYLQGMAMRAEKAPTDLGRDADRMAVVATVERERRDLLAGLDTHERHRPDVRALRWMTEELRVSLFAQQLGTAHAVSEKRIYAAMDAAEAAVEQTRAQGR
ncbi:ATP-dependent helicase HrpA [Kytococcus aerolatus]|uniref:ATP-dependent helicase HrpA n=1 Tax=Kytococcus aerolatus TaxID=592308 RepID=A0A212T4S8_9MICO|nr:ATP-dependent RNA helicase HrpA [Kytococcus aerolatus]SNC61015.1 ATP-dependent helicase HrpA [Kytococcus aerolatus]